MRQIKHSRRVVNEDGLLFATTSRPRTLKQVFCIVFVGPFWCCFVYIVNMFRYEFATEPVVRIARVINKRGP